jgi:hypothetical protein
MTRSTFPTTTMTAGLIVASLLGACAGTSSSPTAAAPAAAAAAVGDVPAMYSQFYGADVSADGQTVVLASTSVPDHPSPYFDTSSVLYEAPHSGMRANPFRIAARMVTLRVPAAPEVAAESETNLGPIGMAVNGVVFFNQYAAGRQPLDDEIRSFDRFNGHPAPSNMYHYHMEPLFLTAQGSSRLVGVLLDGFPVYGTQDSTGRRPTDLDVCNGHVAPTPEFPGGIYHYHVVTEPPYIAGCYRGAPGSRG